MVKYIVQTYGEGSTVLAALEWINLFFQPVVIFIGTFLIIRYVLLEPPLEPERQRRFYIIGIVITAAVFFFISKENASQIGPIMGGTNMALYRKSRHQKRILGIVMVLPLLGLLNGSVGALINMIPFIIPDNDMLSAVLTFLIYIMFIAAALLFRFKGKGWRQWFAEKMNGRRLSGSEYAVMMVSGTLMLAMNAFTSYNLMQWADEAETAEKYFKAPFIAYDLTAVAMSVTLVVMIMQGNKRKLYHDKIADMQFSVISTMADIVENRDENTGGHIKRTAKYVEIIGKKLRAEKMFPDTLTDVYLADMIVAAPLHDIGKIHIPDAILNKPGRLTPEEFDIMKTHTTAGRKVLTQAKSQLGEFDYINTAIEMAEYHHEWWNGKGYPNGISGGEIPLCARIMAVADVFDALTAKRCYKDPMPVEKAYSIIEEETGTHFDPTVAKAFLASKSEVEEALVTLSENSSPELFPKNEKSS